MNSQAINDLEQTVEEGAKAVSAFQSFLDNYWWSIVSGIVILFIGLVLAKLIRRFIQRILSHEKFNASAAGMISQTVYIIVLVLTVTTVLGKLGVPMTSFVTLVGAVGVGVGLALKDSLSNVAAGLLILFFKPFRVGDVVEEENKKMGRVLEIQIMHTILMQMDGCKVLVPNAEISKSRLINYTESPERRIDLKIQISYESDCKKALRLLQELYDKDESILKTPQPVMGISSFDDNGITIAAMPWVKGEDYWTVYFRLMSKIKDIFEQNGIEFPYPQRVVSLKLEEGAGYDPPRITDKMKKRN